MELNKFTERLYEQLVREYFLLKNKTTVLQRINIIEDLYSFAWYLPFGRFSDPRLEGEIKSIFYDAKLDNIPVSSVKNNKIVHIASSLYDQGGHSRILLNWVENDKEHKHSIIISRQSNNVPDWIMNKLKQLCESIIVLDEKNSSIEKAEFILAEVQKGYMSAIFHIHPNDAAPVIAAFHPDFPPIAMFNHSDHVMWMGVSVSDVVINFRELGDKYTWVYRNARRTLLIPFILDNSNPAITNKQAQEKLKIEKYKHVGISVIASYKLEILEEKNFYNFLFNFLSKSPEIVFYLIGPTKEDWKRYMKQSIPENLIITGIIKDISDYIHVADFCLETFPFAGGLGAFDSCRYGAVPIFYNETVEISSLKTVLDYSAYLPEGENLIYYDFENPAMLNTVLSDKRKMQMHAQAVKAYIENTCNEKKWLDKITEIYNLLFTVKHNTELIGEPQIDNSANTLFFNKIIAKSKRNVLYFVLKTGKYSWIRKITKMKLIVLRNILIGKNVLKRR